MEAPSLWIRTLCINNGLRVGDEQVELLSQYVQLLLDWNQKINLISRRDAENVWISHILHSISPLLEFKFAQEPDILDLGSGGGLPGIPLKILEPTFRLTLLDSTQKKITAVQDIIQKLNLDRAEAVWGRAEEYGNKAQYKGKYDYVVSRAVAPLRDLVKWSTGFLKKKGHPLSDKETGSRFAVEPPALIALKGGDLDKELKQTKQNPAIRSFKVVNMTFKGSEQLLENDKKIIVVQF
ncbi:MAG: 16S rRNA (guanine(527)-N(7))-methyltransferase RsmG [Ignavibacteriales bacterium]|nr:16S rRNA (guanine(527)-N(7))-methyltransferase RsmG [Ignavibacteriales bacterium]